MPVFDYKCRECDKTYDVYHKGPEIIEDVVCPACGSAKFKKLISIPAILIGSDTSSPGDFSANSCGSGCCGDGCNLD
jgi:putative FmdB family regulatory protein